jgi:hypothetical protein
MAAIPSQPGTWLSLRDYKSPIQLAAGVNRDVEFERGLKIVTIKIEDLGMRLSRGFLTRAKIAALRIMITRSWFWQSRHR